MSGNGLIGFCEASRAGEQWLAGMQAGDWLDTGYSGDGGRRLDLQPLHFQIEAAASQAQGTRRR
jgi:hypothetical protein